MAKNYFIFSRELTNEKIWDQLLIELCNSWYNNWKGSNIWDNWALTKRMNGVSSFQSAFTCSNLTMETLEQGVKCVQS